MVRDLQMYKLRLGILTILLLLSPPPTILSEWQHVALNEKITTCKTEETEQGSPLPLPAAIHHWLHGIGRVEEAGWVASPVPPSRSQAPSTKFLGYLRTECPPASWRFPRKAARFVLPNAAVRLLGALSPWGTPRPHEGGRPWVGRAVSDRARPASVPRPGPYGARPRRDGRRPPRPARGAPATRAAAAPTPPRRTLSNGGRGRSCASSLPCLPKERNTKSGGRTPPGATQGKPSGR